MFKSFGFWLVFRHVKNDVYKVQNERSEFQAMVVIITRVLVSTMFSYYLVFDYS